MSLLSMLGVVCGFGGGLWVFFFGGVCFLFLVVLGGVGFGFFVGFVLCFFSLFPCRVVGAGRFACLGFGELGLVVCVFVSLFFFFFVFFLCGRGGWWSQCFFFWFVVFVFDFVGFFFFLFFFLVFFLCFWGFC